MASPTRPLRLLRAVALSLGLMLLLSGCPYSTWQDTTRELINDSRAANGRSRLPMSINVAKKAQAWANHLADCRCLAHSNLAAGMPRGWTAIAENVGYGTPGGNLVSIHRSFMRSSGHRGNVLDTRWNVVGTGVAARGRTKYVVHVYARY
jgi:uncharacterized protein YkwD